MHMHSILFNRHAALAGLLIVATPWITQVSGADAPGVARISDGSSSAIEPAGFRRQMEGDVQYAPGPVADGAYVDSGYVDEGDDCPSCRRGGRCRGAGGCRWCNGGYGGSHPWINPTVYPIGRTPNVYSQYWSGGKIAGCLYPMAYQPTDTAQLGFYYTHVPTWGSRPGALPPAPRPNWPIRGGSFASGWGSGAGGSCPVGTGGMVTPPAANDGVGVPPAPQPIAPIPEARLAPRTYR